LYGLFAGMFYSGYYLLTQPGRKYLNTISFLYISTFSTSVILGIYGLIFGYSFTGYTNETWTLFIIMGVLVQAGGWFLINFAQGYVPASMVAPTLLFQPVIAGIIEWFLPNGKLTGLHIIGGIIVVLGIYMIHYSRNRNAAK
jgi:drug/metabolite transporter (DMT)-like permease